MRRASPMISSLSLPTSGSQNRQGRGLVDDADVVERLARHLPERLPGHERLGSLRLGDLLGDAEHQATVQQHAKVRRREQ